MHAPGRSIWLTAALWANAAALALLAVSLRGRDAAPAFAQQQPIAGGAGVFVMPAQLAPNAWGCYLLDVDAQTLAVYHYLPDKLQLRLLAARNFRYDRRLGNLNTSPPPGEVRELLEREAQPFRSAEPAPPDGGAPAIPEP